MQGQKKFNNTGKGSNDKVSEYLISVFIQSSTQEFVQTTQTAIVKCSLFLFVNKCWRNDRIYVITKEM